MTTPARPILRLRSQELVPADEDRKVEIGVFDVLLPCRKFDVAYKVAVLGKVSQSLEFLLRLVKTVPGLSAQDAGAFFGYSQSEIAFVLEEATGPGYVELRKGRLWLTSAGDGLFRDDAKDPAIYSVEERRKDAGFDLLAIAPQVFRSLDSVEQVLPELPMTEVIGKGRVSDQVPQRFGLFFREFWDSRDREQVHKRDLYSIDHVIPSDKFQVPVRIGVVAQASSPSLPEIDLSSWRPEHEVADRPQIESAAAALIDDLKVDANQVNAAGGYAVLADLAPEFLKEYITRNGLNANRYWREAVGRAGEPRIDRKTVTIIGPLYSEANAKRLLDVIEYGLRDTLPPELILSVAPQTKHWAASTQQRDTLAFLRRGIAAQLPASNVEIKATCLHPGKSPWYIDRAFEEVHRATSTDIPAALEFLLVPHVAVAILVHAPIGASSGYPVPMGFASFDPAVLKRAQDFVAARVIRYVEDPEAQRCISDALAPRPEPSSEPIPGA